MNYRFVQEFVLDGFLKIIFVRTAENDADIFAKKFGGDLLPYAGASVNNV